MGLFRPVLRLTPKKIARGKAERDLSVKNLLQNNKFSLLLIVGRFSPDVAELYFVKQ